MMIKNFEQIMGIIAELQKLAQEVFCNINIVSIRKNKKIITILYEMKPKIDILYRLYELSYSEFHENDKDYKFENSIAYLRTHTNVLIYLLKSRKAEPTDIYNLSFWIYTGLTTAYNILMYPE